MSINILFLRLGYQVISLYPLCLSVSHLSDELDRTPLSAHRQIASKLLTNSTARFHQRQSRKKHSVNVFFGMHWDILSSTQQLGHAIWTDICINRNVVYKLYNYKDKYDILVWGIHIDSENVGSILCLPWDCTKTAIQENKKVNYQIFAVHVYVNKIWKLYFFFYWFSIYNFVWSSIFLSF